MKVVVIGGAGVFGSRLVEMLIHDGHAVTVAGRRAGPLRAVAMRLGASHLTVDRSGDLAALWAAAPEVVIDAAGPFHGYGKDPYALPRACIAQGVNYLDLADDAAFCAGISQLDEAARAAGVFALSGVSSVPALSSAVVASLAQGGSIDAISSAILPGNRAPRGRAVVESILHQAGCQMTQIVDGVAVPIRSWSQPRDFDLGQGVTRRGYVIGVPDQVLFPAFFKARTVTFHAGLELGVMNRGLAALAWMRHHLTFPMPVALTYHAAKLLAPFGTDQGGMAVRVVMMDGTRHDWRLLVRAGEGPYVPGIMARALLRDAAVVASGARPALAEVPLDVITETLSDLAATTDRQTTQPRPLFHRVLGKRFAELPTAVQDCHMTHAPRRWVGTAQVARGTGVWPRLIAGVMGLPPAAAATPLIVTKVPVARGEVWQRDFGGQVFHSTLRKGARGLTETFGPLTFDLDLQVAADGLHFPVSAGRLFGMALPKWALPRSVARESDQNGVFHFDVALYAPLTGQMIIRYRGSLTRVKTERV